VNIYLNNFSTLLLSFATQVDLVWERYETAGPGKVDSALFEPIEQLASRLNTLLDGSLPADVDRGLLSAAIQQATDLSRRCATLPQGLCFVSGEAGLVPRRDQIDAFAAARMTVRTIADRLGGD
jgi:hypothetical protein